MGTFVQKFISTKGLLVNLPELLVYDWDQLVRRLLQEAPDSGTIKAIVLEIIDVCSKEDTDVIYNFDRMLQPVLIVLLSKHFDEAWPYFGEALNTNVYRTQAGLILLLTNSVESMIENAQQPIAEAPTEKLATMAI